MSSRDERLVVFDLDGVIADSSAGLADAVNATLRSWGLPPQRTEQLTFLFGPPLHEGFAVLLERLGADPTDSVRFTDDYRAGQTQMMRERARLYPGIEQALATIASRERLRVATAKPMALAEALLESLGMRRYFDGVHAPADDRSGHTKQLTVGQALAAAGHPPAAVMIGDRASDVMAARAHGLGAIAVSWGYGPRAELDEARPDALAHTPAELPELVRRLLAQAQRA